MPIIRTCRISGKEFIISDREIALIEKLSPTIGGEKFPIPLPTLCPEERRRRRLQFRNYFTLFKRVDPLLGSNIISIYPPDSQYTVYSQGQWWSDTWDAKIYAAEYTPSQSVFEQIYGRFLTVPLPALDNAYLDLENSEYINNNGKSKDCYLVSCGNNNEKVLYSWFVFNSSNILDSNYVRFSENCSFSQHIGKCYDVHFSWNASECRESRYLFSCTGCSNILGGVGLENQSYQILNTPCTKDEFDAVLTKIKKDNNFRKDFEKKVQNLITQGNIQDPITTGSIDSTGDFCYESKNALECSNIGDCEDVAHITDSFGVVDSIGLDQWGENMSLSYENVDCGLNASHIYWCISCWENAEYNFYSRKCKGCTYIFGCSSLKNQSYCIFNKQYTKEEWEKTVKKIIVQMQSEGTWGEFLDAKYSPFPYNESHAMEQLPLSKFEAEARGVIWSDRPDITPEGITKIIPGERLPDNIEGIPDDVLHWAIKCIQTGKLFQIQPIELEMLRKYGIPLPKIHPVERIKNKFQWDRREFSFEF